MFSDEDPETLFLLTQSIADGSFGSVYKGIRIEDGKEVAVKICELNDESFEDVKNETRILEACEHNNIVAFYGAFQKDDTVWMAMEFCAGGAANDIIDLLESPLPEDIISHVIHNVVNGLVYLHSNGIIHRDLKAANILLTIHGDVRLGELTT